MSELIGVFLWLALTGFFTFIAIQSGDIHNLGFAIIALFFLLGIVMLIKAIRRIIVNICTASRGTLTYGKVTRIRNTCTKESDCAIFMAEIVLEEESGLIGRYMENIGISLKYEVGDFVKVKYYKDDINIISGVYEREVPERIRNRLNAEAQKPGSTLYMDYNNSYDNQGETIVIDGVEYIKKN